MGKLKSDELKAQIETFNGVMADDYGEMEERFLDLNAEYLLFYERSWFSLELDLIAQGSYGNDA